MLKALMLLASETIVKLHKGMREGEEEKKKNNTQFIPFYKYHFINKIQLPAYFTHLPHSNRSSLKRQRMK